MLKSTIAFVALFVLFTSLIEAQISGSWKLKEIHYQYQDTTYKLSEMNGRLLISEAGAYGIQYERIAGPRKAFENLSKPSEEEIIGAFRSVVFNSGTYELEDQVFITTADIAKVPGFENGVQYYRFKIEENQLELVMFDETYPSGKKPDWYQKLEILFLFERE